MTNSSPWYRCPIEIDGLPINSMVIFHGYVSHNQMVILNPFFHDLFFDAVGMGFDKNHPEKTASKIQPYFVAWFP